MIFLPEQLIKHYNTTIIAVLFALLLSPFAIALDAFTHWALETNSHPYWYLIDASLTFIIAFPASLFLLKLTEHIYLKEQELIIALNKVKQFESILPICAGCKNIRDKAGAWHMPDIYIQDNTNASVSHGLCDICVTQIKDNKTPTTENRHIYSQ